MVDTLAHAVLIGFVVVLIWMVITGKGYGGEK